VKARIAAFLGLGLVALLLILSTAREPEVAGRPEPAVSDAALDRDAESSAPEPEAGTADLSAADLLPPPVDLAAADRDLDLCGRVVDAEGAPVAGARIEALVPAVRWLGFADPWTPRVRALDRETRSAIDGTFLFRLARGELRDLRVTHPGFAETELPTCAAGERVEIVLHPGARVVVTASDSEGRPVAAVQVRLWARTGAGTRSDRRAETDESGVAEIAGLPPGRTSIELRHDSLWCTDLRDIALCPGETVELAVLLREGRTVSGTVLDRETGLPVAGALVIDGQIFLSGRSATTDSAGHYTLSGLQFLELRAEAEGYGQARVELSLESEATIDIELPRGDAAVGIVVDETGAPLAGIGVAAVIPGGQSPYRETRRASTAENGSFRIASLHPEGPHTLVVIEPGFARTHLDFDPRLRRPDGVIDLGTIVLRPGRSIAGELVDADGAPVGGSSVHLFGHGADRDRLLPGSGIVAIGNDGSSDARRTDDLGRFRFADLAVGEYQLSASIPGWPGARETVRIEERGVEPVHVRLALPGGEEYELRIETPEGDPVPGVRLSASTGRKGDFVSDTSDDAGIVRIGGIPSPFEVRLDLPRGYLRRFPFQVDPRGGTGTIVVEREALVSGIVLAPDGTPLPRLYLDVIEREPSPEFLGGRIAQTQFDGTFEIPLSPGAEIDLVCRGVCESGDLRGPSTQVWTGFQGRREGLVAPAEGVRFRLERVACDRSLVVRAVDAAGAPVEGVRVLASIDGSKAEAGAAETDAEGIATLDDLPALELFVRCQPPEPPPGSAWSWIAPGAERLTPSGQEWRVELQRGATLTGIVVDESGAPVDGAIVRANTSAERHLAVKCPDGEFELILLDGETADLDAEGRRVAGGKIPRGELRGVAAGPEPVRIVILEDR